MTHNPRKDNLSTF